MIIIEGCDNTGKTTLAKKIAQELNYEYVKENLPEGDGFEYYLRRVDELNDNVVLDRFHLGERVYPFVKKDGRKGLTLEQQHEIEGKLIGRKATLVFCDTNKKTIADLFDKNNEDYVSKDQIKQIKLLFYEAIRKSLLNEVIFDITFSDAVQSFLFNMIIEREKQCQEEKSIL